MTVDILNGKAAYYHAPKCGSRTILGWITILETPEIFKKYPHWFKKTSIEDPVYGEIRKRVKVLSSGIKILNNYPVRFCVIRDPVERFISGYTNRIVFHKDLIKLKNPPGTISDFIKNFDFYCDNDPSTKLHFSPQNVFYGTDLSLYTHIFKFKNFDKIKSLLQEISGTSLPDIHLQQSGSVQKPTLSNTEIEWVKEVYREDYNLYKNYID